MNFASRNRFDNITQKVNSENFSDIMCDTEMMTLH